MQPPSGLVGRLAELDAIAAGLAPVFAGRAAAVRIVGDAGSGKTALLDAAMVNAAAQGAMVLRVASSAAESASPWSTLAMLLAQVPSDSIDALSESQRSALDMAIGRVPSGNIEIGTTVSTALRDLLRELAADRALVLSLDDTPWIDTATASAIAVALRTLQAAPVGVATAERPGSTPVLELDRILPAVTVEVPPLRRSDLQQLLRERGVGVSSPQLDDIEALTGGNALHASLLADHLRRPDRPTTRMPSSIAAGFEAQIARLSDDARTTLVMASIAGSTDVDLLASCLPGIDVESAVIDVERAGLTVESPSPGPASDSGRVRPVVAAVVDDRLGPVERRRLHRTIADALTVDDERRAAHLGASCSHPDADVADALDRAAAEALARGARHAAGKHFARSAELTPPDHHDDRWRRDLAAADAFFGAGALDLAETPSLAAFDLADDPMQLALAGGVRTQILAARGDVVATHGFVVALLERLDEHTMLLGLLGRARVRLEQIFDLHSACDTAEHLHVVMAAAGLHDLATEFAVAAANCRFLLGHPVDVAETWTVARPIVDAADFIGAGWMALELLVWGCHDHELVSSALDEFERGASASGSLQSLAKVHDFRGNHLIRVGEWKQGEHEMRRAVDAATLSELTGSMATGGLAWILAATGRVDEAAEMLSSGASDAPNQDTLVLNVSRASTAGFVELCAGRWEAAVEAYTQAWSDADKLGLDDLCALPFRVDLIECLILCGRIEEASERAARVAELADRSQRFAAMMQAERACVLVRAAHRDVEGAVAAAQRAMVHHRLADVPIERARLQLAVGTALRRAGRRNDAATALGEAASIFDRLGAVPFAARTHDELDRLGHRRAPHELTETEAQIARLVAAGRTNAEVAAELFVSLRTVESNLTRVYRKLGLRSRSELAARAGELG